MSVHPPTQGTPPVPSARASGSLAEESRAPARDKARGNGDRVPREASGGWHPTRQGGGIRAIRRPVVAGYYYPADPIELRSLIDPWTQGAADTGPARAVVVPHGSYRHSGAIAAATLSRVTIPRRCIILGPSHTGAARRWSVMSGGAYRTPLGDVPIDGRCADALRDRCAFLENDASAQHGEHAIEVPLPLLQRLGPRDLAIVPIIANSNDPDELRRLARALAQVVRLQEEPVLLIATSDLSHYESVASGSEQDRILLKAILALDGRALVHRLEERSLVMCGAGAVVCVLDAATQLGGESAALVAYGTSAAAGGDPHSVTGYAGVVIR